MEVLVDEAEVDDAPAELGIEPCHTVTHYTVAVDTTNGGVAAKTLGVDLTEEEGVEVVYKVVGNLTCQVGLYAKTVGKGELVLPYGYIVAAYEGEAEVAIALTVDDVGSAYECSFDVETACGVAVVVACVVNKACLELEHITTMSLVIADETDITIELVKGILSIVSLEVYVVGEDVVVAESCSPVKVACDTALNTGNKAELVAAHPVELGLLALVVPEAGAEVGRCITVEAIEVKLLGIEVGAIEEKFALGDKGLEIAVAAKQ